MSTLILPVAGKSSRFPNMRPKWLLTMPDGKLMIEKSISQINLNSFSKVLVICLREHINNYIPAESLISIIKNIGIESVELCILDKETNSQSETVVSAIRKNKIEGSIYVKDCDNTFASGFNGKNTISVLDLNQIELVDAKNKSYVTIDSIGNVTNIVEKQVISNFFCCGGYGFSSAKEFEEAYKSIKSKGEIYISHVIYKMLLDGVSFTIERANNYIDWGTLREYRHYCKQYVTLFCDVDGVLLKNGSKFGESGWKTAAISENLKKIAQLKDEGRLYLVITSSRPAEEIDYIKDILSQYAIQADQFVMGLPHTKRIIVNDYSQTNPYPTAFSINLERDSKSLSMLLENLLD